MKIDRSKIKKSSSDVVCVQFLNTFSVRFLIFQSQNFCCKVCTILHWLLLQPSECNALIECIKSCGVNEADLLEQLKQITTWTYGKVTIGRDYIIVNSVKIRFFFNIQKKSCIIFVSALLITVWTVSLGWCIGHFWHNTRISLPEEWWKWVGFTLWFARQWSPEVTGSTSATFHSSSHWA